MTIDDLKRKTATRVLEDSGVTSVFYHDTAVVQFNNNVVELDTGEFLTKTTKARMNQVSEVFGLGFEVFQRNFEWFVKTPHGVFEFEDNFFKFAR